MRRLRVVRSTQLEALRIHYLLSNKEYHVNLDRQLGLDPYKHKPRLTFRADGTFKVTVFSDLHFGENPEGPWGPVQDTNSTRLMRRVLRDEKPDYVCVVVLV